MELFIIGLVSGFCIGFTLSRMVAQKEQIIVEKPVQKIKYSRQPRDKFFCPRCHEIIQYEHTYDSDNGICCPFCNSVLERKK